MAAKEFRALVQQAMKAKKPLQVLGTVNPYAALMAQKVGAKCLYLSGSGVATASHGLPDLGITNHTDVVDDVRKITDASRLPLLVDIDTGFGGAFNIMRTVHEIAKAGAAACHMEDQFASKRCGHRPNKQIVKTQEMVDRIKAADEGRRNGAHEDFVIMARTDALDSEGMAEALRRCEAYINAGADMLFPEACRTLEEYKEFSKLGVPVLANITEFGQTPLFTVEELGEAGVSMALYPLSAFRAMNQAAMETYKVILRDGTQKAALPLMQTRKELYEVLEYHDYEERLDRLYLENSDSEDDEQ